MKGIESKTKAIQIKDENEWKKIFKDQEASKLSQADYCRINKINFNAFYIWTRQFFMLRPLVVEVILD
jgi:hypothetical protein